MIIGQAWSFEFFLVVFGGSLGALYAALGAVPARLKDALSYFTVHGEIWTDDDDPANLSKRWSYPLLLSIVLIGTVVVAGAIYFQWP